MHSITFITIAIAALMVSVTQATEIEERANIFSAPVFSSGSLSTNTNPNGFKPQIKRDIPVVGLPGSGTSAGKMVTSNSSGGFFNKRGGVKVHPEKKRDLSLDASGTVTSGGFGKMRVDTSTTIVKRECDKAKSEPKKAVVASKPCNNSHPGSHRKRAVVPVVGDILHNLSHKEASKKSHVRRSHPEPKKAVEAKPCKDSHSGSHRKRELPIVGTLLANAVPKKATPKGIRVKRSGVKFYPSRLTMKRHDELVSNSPTTNVNITVPVRPSSIIPVGDAYNPKGKVVERSAPDNRTPSNGHPDVPGDVGRDIVVINTSGGKA